MNLAKLAEFGIKATVTQAGKLHLEAPQGTLTPELRQEIAQNRDFLLAEVESVNIVNLVNIKSSCIGSGARAYTQASQVHTPEKAGSGEHCELGELQNHLYGPARAHIYPESHVHQQAANDPDSTPAAVLDPDQHCYPHTDACNTGELALMATRLETFARIGVDVDQAERLADKLLARDREGDDRHLCLECSSLTGGMGNWRCMAFRQRGARDPGLPADYTGMLTRCSSFNAGEPVADVYASVRALPPRPAPKPVEQQYHPLTPQQQVAARDYHKHHFACARCISAGQGRGERCQRGAELWSAYTAGDGDAR